MFSDTTRIREGWAQYWEQRSTPTDHRTRKLLIEMARPAGLVHAPNERSEFGRELETAGRGHFNEVELARPCRTRTCDLLVRRRGMTAAGSRQFTEDCGFSERSCMSDFSALIFPRDSESRFRRRLQPRCECSPIRSRRSGAPQTALAPRGDVANPELVSPCGLETRSHHGRLFSARGVLLRVDE